MRKYDIFLKTINVKSVNLNLSDAFKVLTDDFIKEENCTVQTVLDMKNILIEAIKIIEGDLHGF